MLPLILAGPIVRRVDAKTCSVWAALSRAADLELKVWAGSQMSSGIGTVESNMAPIGTGTAKTRQFGAKLHVVIVAIDVKPDAVPPNPAPPSVILTPGGIFAYDLVIDGNANLRSEGLLKDETAGARLTGVHPDAPLHLALGYEEDRLPSFVTAAATIDQIRVAHASCRKANHVGYDAMGWLDDWIKDKRDLSPAELPQQLYLTGDQIYADDVATSLLPMLTDLGTELLGGPDSIYVFSNLEVHLTAESFPPLRRGKFVHETLKLSTTESANHLLGFGEFAAMYLAAWSSRVWRALGTDATMFVAGDHPDTAQYLTQWEICHNGDFDAWKSAAKKEFQDSHDRERTEAYRNVVPKAARALANCVTYMIWDDHEVTDDWNLSGRWVTRVYASNSGRQLVRNGMLAYGIFQGWGNDPEAFKTGNNKDFLDEAAKFGSFGNGYLAPEGQIDEILGFPGAADAKRAKWGYRVDAPRHRTIVLDTRTRRDTGSAMSTKAPKLLGASLDDQIATGPLSDGRELLMVVSGAPVLGPTIFDRVFQPLAAIATDAKNVIGKLLEDRSFDPCKAMRRQLALTDGDMATDLEGWGADEAAQEALLKKLATYTKVVVLSGDVHYACTLDMEYWRKSTPASSRIVQLTCSGARNGWPIGIESQFRKNTVFQDLLRGVLVERVAWDGEAQVTTPARAHIGPGRRARMKRSPSLLPTIGWPAGTTVTREPDWLWRLRLVRDDRTGGVDGAPADPPPIPATAGEGSFESYVAVLQRHQLATLQKPRLLRTLNFLSNVGLVSLSADGKQLTHTLLSAIAPDAQSYGKSTVHVIDFNPTGAAKPILQTN